MCRYAVHENELSNHQMDHKSSLTQKLFTNINTNAVAYWTHLLWQQKFNETQNMSH